MIFPRKFMNRSKPEGNPRDEIKADGISSQSTRAEPEDQAAQNVGAREARGLKRAVGCGLTCSLTCFRFFGPKAFICIGPSANL
jgi:hypothetical protein